MILESEQATLDLGERLAKLIMPGDKIALSGELGAGKTTLARGVLRGLGFEEEVPSPTFAIVQQYDPPETRLSIAHADFYRIENASELQELGLDDILNEGALMAEWPDRIPGKFWDGALKLGLKIGANDIRQLTCSVGVAWKDRWPIK